MKNGFLPISRQDMEERGWEQLDFICVTGDAYVDHPSFGHAIITRVLENKGFRVGIIAQPDWRSAKSFKVLGRPRLGFLITAGNIDSMVNHYTASKKPRRQDIYSPGGKAGLRPDRATIVYANRVREAYKNIPVILGGIEASLRRFAHYDYWSDKVRASILIDAQADLLVYGMGENPIVEIAEALDSGLDIKDISYIPGTCYISSSLEKVYEYRSIESYEAVRQDKIQYAKAFLAQYREQDALRGKRLVQRHSQTYLVQNPPTQPLKQREMDAVYALPYQRTYHPIYQKDGGIPAIEEVEFSITSSRGCFGSCSFCALTFHQGRVIQSRSHPSIIREARMMTYQPKFKGYIHDVGGPTANFRNPSCRQQEEYGTCPAKQCLFPKPCKKLEVSHEDYLGLLRELREIPDVKKVFIRSGLRYDYIMADKEDTFFKELIQHHVSGQLKVAPEHVSPKVLSLMGKPGRDVYDLFVQKYFRLNRELGKEQYLVPYLMSSHPGSDLKAAIELAEYLRDIGHQPEQVQDFYPTPGTLSTCMFYTGLDPRTMKPVYVPKSPHEKAMQRALLQYRRPENYKLVYQALVQAGRHDLIGYDRKCLIRPPVPRRPAHEKSNKLRRNSSAKGNRKHS